jgi:hypothetical protein
MRPEATAPAGSVHSEIATAATPARQKQPYILGILFLIFASLAAIIDGGVLMPLRPRSNQPSAIQLSAAGDVLLCNAAAMWAAMWIVEWSIAFSPPIRSQDGHSDAPMCYVFGSLAIGWVTP